MNGKPILYRDQYGQTVFAKTTRELKAKCGGRLSKMYVDMKDGSTSPTQSPENTRRAHAAHSACRWMEAVSSFETKENSDFQKRELKRYEKRISTEASEDNIIDLLANLRHLCNRLNLNFDDLNATAENHYREEIK